MSFRSKFEREFARDLIARGIEYEYESWVLPYYLPVPGGVCSKCSCSEVVSFKRYTPDFWLPRQGVWVETKGKFSSKDRTKMKAIVTQYPKDTFIMVFQRNNRLSKTSPMTYGEWCDKHGILWCLDTLSDAVLSGGGV